MTKLDLELYCVTNRRTQHLEKTNLRLAGVGKEVFPNSYILSNHKDNIYHKERFYSELTFHYWYWKNYLDLTNNNWIGFCQRRRIWIKKSSENKLINKDNLNEHILEKADESWQESNAIICKPINLNPVKKMKIIKRGWRSMIKDPSILFDKSKQNILLHFDMHHGYGNLERAINLLDTNDRHDFYNYVTKNTKFNPHIMYIAKKKVLNQWFKNLFEWLERCETIFDKKSLTGYDSTRLFAFLAERYASFWFKKYTKYKEQPWVFIDPTN